LTEDGDFGPKTKARVTLFKNKNGISNSDNGIVDESTWAQLKPYITGTYKTPMKPAEPSVQVTGNSERDYWDEFLGYEAQYLQDVNPMYLYEQIVEAGIIERDQYTFKQFVIDNAPEWEKQFNEKTVGDRLEELVDMVATTYIIVYGTVYTYQQIMEIVEYEKLVYEVKNAQSAAQTKLTQPMAADNVSINVRTNSTAAQGVVKTINSFDDVEGYIKQNGKLPDNFITKDQAKALGWNPKTGNLTDVAPGKSIGGDIFRNAESKLPSAPGRIWYEADINYSSGFRGSERILYSNDGLIYKTTDHYNTFTQIK
jgi:hypothetical protein